MACNPCNFPRCLAPPCSTRHELIKIAAEAMRYMRRMMLELTEVAVPKSLFVALLAAPGRTRWCGSLYCRYEQPVNSSPF